MLPLIRHLLHPQLVCYLKNPEKILILEGVRQTGKTTAIRMALKERTHTFITLSDEDFPVIQVRESKTFEEFERNLKRNFQFTPHESAVLVLDEAQRARSLYGFILQMERKWKGTAVILSGSVMGAFFKRPEHEKTVSPAGRILKLICRPFSFYEFLEFTGKTPLLDAIRSFDFRGKVPDYIHQEAMTGFYEYLTTGGFPEAITKREDTQALYNYFQTLLSFFWQDADRYLTEVIGSPHYQYGRLMHAVFEAISRHSGDKTQRSSLISSDSPAYRTTLPALLDALEEWHFLFRLQTRMKAASTKQGSSSKKYLWDVGVANCFLNLNRPVHAATDPTLLSKLLEAAVAQELVFYLQTKERLASWQTNQKQTHEMDFLASFPHIEAGIEVKASSHINHKAISQLKEFAHLNPLAQYGVVYTGSFERIPFGGKTMDWIPPYLLGRVASDLAAHRSKLKTRVDPPSTNP